MAISGIGWELHLERLRQHRHDDQVRTYGRYAVYIDGIPVDGLDGYMSECEGPGESDRSSTSKRRRRVTEGRYDLLTHYTHYRSSGYSETAARPTPEHAMPAFGLEDRGARSGILVHPAHPPNLFLSSIGCLNPTSSLDSDQVMSLNDSRSRVIALLASLRRHDPEAFAGQLRRRIAAATILIEGEPTD